MSLARLIWLALFSFTSCQTTPPPELFIENVVVSMTHAGGMKGKSLQKGDYVEQRWCARRDKALLRKIDEDPALIDEAILKAQKTGKGGDFISDASIYLSGRECATVSGTQMRFVDSKLK